MLINERMSVQTYNSIDNLQSRFQAKLHQEYRLETFTGFLKLLYHAIQHLYFFPSNYLSKKSKESLDFYVSNISQIRKHLLNFEHQIKQGTDLPSHDMTCQLTDGTVVEFRLQFAGQAQFFYLKNDASEWELQPFTPKELLEEIEKDILNNPVYFDPRLVASCELNGAIEIIEDLGRTMMEENRIEAMRRRNGNVHFYGAEELMDRLTNPNDSHNIRLVQHIEEIADNLLKSGIYDNQSHPQEPTFRQYDFFNLRVVIEFYISRNLDHLLLGNMTEANRDAIKIALRLLEKLATNDLSDEVNNKTAFIRAVSNQDFNTVSLDSHHEPLLVNYLKDCMNQTNHINHGTLALAKKIIDRLPHSQNPDNPLSAETLTCYRHLRNDLDEIEFAIYTLNWENEIDADEQSWSGQIAPFHLELDESNNQ